MPDKNSNTQDIDISDNDKSVTTEHERVAALIPFILRAWWLREFKDYSDLNWTRDLPVTGPVWSSYSDPLCDQGNIDYGAELL